MKSAFRILLFLFFLLSGAYYLVGDAIRGSVTEVLEVSSQTQAEGSFHLEELTALNLGPGASFFTGIELELTIPQELMRFRNSFAVYLYRKVNPAPEKGGMRRYYGESLDYYVVPATRKMYLQIPLRRNAGLPKTPETVALNHVTSLADYPLLLTILPIMKGIPSNIYNAVVELKAYPYLAEEGILDLSVTVPGSEPYTLLIDGKEPAYRENGYLLSTGVHELSIESDAYLPLKRSVSISKGNRTQLKLTLEKREPRVNFEVPDGTVIFLDGERVNSTSLKVKEGSHSVVFKLGDYSMTKEFEVSGGKNYTVTLFFDVFVKEN